MSAKTLYMQRNWDPDVKRFFGKIINSISLTLLWMLSCATAGIYFKLGYFNEGPVFRPVLFYSAMVLTLFLLIRYLYRIWNR